MAPNWKNASGDDVEVTCSECGDTLPFAFPDQQGDIVCRGCQEDAAEPDHVDFAPGDRVVDDEALTEYRLGERDSPPSIAVVIAQVAERADAHHPPGVGKTVARMNRGYPPDDRVIRVAFIGGDKGLDNRVGSERWRHWPQEHLLTRLADYRARWKSWPKTYDYPGLRLIPVGEHVSSDDEELDPVTAETLGTR